MSNKRCRNYLRASQKKRWYGQTSIRLSRRAAKNENAGETDMKTKILGLLAVGLLAAPNAFAVQVLWTAQVPSDGTCGGMLGSFVFDYDSGVYSDVRLSSGFLTGCLFGGDELTSGTTLYTSATGNASGLTASSGVYALTLNFSPALSDLGGQIVASGSDTDGLRPFGFFYNFSMIGTAVPVSAPEPGTLALLGLGLAGLGLSRRRKA
jgi:hypothetical protein